MTRTDLEHLRDAIEAQRREQLITLPQYIDRRRRLLKLEFDFIVDGDRQEAHHAA